MLTIRIRRSTAALRQAVLVGGAGFALMAVVVFGVFSGGMATLLIWGLLGCGGLLVTGATFAAHGLTPTVVTVDDETLTVRSRGLLEIQSREFARSLIADVRVDRLPFNNTLLRPHVVNVVLGHGGEHQLIVATRAEARYVADALRGELRLPPERWPEMGYPPRPCLSRVTRTIHPLGVVLSVHPSLVPAWFAAAAPLLAIAALLIAGQVLDRTEPARWHGWFFVWAGAYCAMMSAAVLATAYKLRTRYALAIDRKTVTLRETGLRPGEVEWPASAIADISPRRHRWRRPGVEAVFPDGTRVLLIPRLPRRDVGWVCASARRALHLGRCRPLVDPCD